MGGGRRGEEGGGGRGEGRVTGSQRRSTQLSEWCDICSPWGTGRWWLLIGAEIWREVGGGGGGVRTHVHVHNV